MERYSAWRVGQSSDLTAESAANYAFAHRLAQKPVMVERNPHAEPNRASNAKKGSRYMTETSPVYCAIMKLNTSTKP